MDRIKRISYEVLDRHKSKCSESFSDNKKLLDEVAIIRSKGLRNKIAGYITRCTKKENREKEIKKSKTDSLNDENTPLEETLEIEKETDKEPDKEPEENIIEVGADTTDVSEINEPSEEKTE